MTSLYAEVIGDPIDHSKSPLIHRFWLGKSGVDADYRATRVGIADLTSYLDARRRDPAWRGCNVTAPLKRAAAAEVGDPAGACASLGAVNCVVRSPLGCTFGFNSDVAGIDEMLAGLELSDSKVCIIGAGGAARAALCALNKRPPAEIALIARDVGRARMLRRLLPKSVRLGVRSFSGAVEALNGAKLVVNASPLGMAGQPGMPPPILDGLPAGAVIFDMVYAPLETPLLKAARERQLRAIDGLTMLIGQAAPAFELFFGKPAPREHDAQLKALLTS